MFKKSCKCYKSNKYRPGMYDQTDENILRDISGYNFFRQFRSNVPGDVESSEP